MVGQLNTTFAERFAVGIIDKDKVELGYIKECEPIAKTPHLTLLKHKERCQYLITIAPAVDRFLLDCAEGLNVDPTRFEIPSDLKNFTKLSKSITSNTDQRFKALFPAIQEHEEIHCLRETLVYLCQKKYNADTATLKKHFTTNS